MIVEFRLLCLGRRRFSLLLSTRQQGTSKPQAGQTFSSYTSSYESYALLSWNRVDQVEVRSHGGNRFTTLLNRSLGRSVPANYRPSPDRTLYRGRCP